MVLDRRHDVGFPQYGQSETEGTRAEGVTLSASVTVLGCDTPLMERLLFGQDDIARANGEGLAFCDPAIDKMGCKQKPLQSVALATGWTHINPKLTFASTPNFQQNVTQTSKTKKKTGRSGRGLRSRKDSRPQNYQRTRRPRFFPSSSTVHDIPTNA